MINSPVAMRAHLASFVGVALVGYERRSPSEQAAARAQLQARLQQGLAELPGQIWRSLDLQHHILLQLPPSPEHALHLLQYLLQAPPALLDGWKLAVHVGVVREEADLHGHPRPIGEGVTRTLALAAQAGAGQAVASRAFVEAVRGLHDAYAALFESSEDETVLQGDRWPVKASSAVLAQLRQSLPSAAVTSQTPGDETSMVKGVGQARDLVARWFVPVNALMFSIILLLGQGGRIGLTPERLGRLAALLVLLGVGWLLGRAVLRRWRQPVGWLRHRGVGWVLITYGVLLSAGVFLSSYLPMVER